MNIPERAMAELESARREGRQPRPVLVEQTDIDQFVEALYQMRPHLRSATRVDHIEISGVLFQSMEQA